MNEDLQTLRASAIVNHPRPPRRWSAGRICEQDGCETRLSVYNASAACFAHQSARAFVSPVAREGGRAA